VRQSLAIFIDAYRELNSKKLFWIVMGLSGLVVAIFAMVGINETGFKLLWFTIPSGFFNTHIISEEMFYKLLFANLGVKMWLAWASTILALIATAGIFPDLIASGSIELTLSKPISRLRLFITKYLSGLVFTALQVLVFTTACFLVLGFRAGLWLPGIFWAVPLMVLFFSYLFAICVILGLITRSTVASLLITVLLWFCVFLMHTGERSLLTFREVSVQQQERVQNDIKTMQKAIGDFRSVSGADAQLPPTLAKMQDTIERRERSLGRIGDIGQSIRKWHSVLFAVKTVLPKTSETLELLERVLVSKADIEQLRQGREPEEQDTPLGPDDVPIRMERVTDRVQDIVRSRSLWWVIGTSLAFEAVLVGIGAWIFSRRDF
jgi:ABC-type transport system involved in multi-copper enzyme maturation permease subunit